MGNARNGCSLLDRWTAVGRRYPPAPASSTSCTGWDFSNPRPPAAAASCTPVPAAWSRATGCGEPVRALRATLIAAACRGVRARQQRCAAPNVAPKTLRHPPPCSRDWSRPSAGGLALRHGCWRRIVGRVRSARGGSWAAAARALLTSVRAKGCRAAAPSATGPALRPPAGGTLRCGARAATAYARARQLGHLSARCLARVPTRLPGGRASCRAPL
jgi:hypothetical protein